jgi:phage tail sheath protein FI
MLGILGFTDGIESADAIVAKNSAGLDDYSLMLMKDYVSWDDPTNEVRRLIPPEAVALGAVGRLSPEQGVGNKPIFGIAGTSRSIANQRYFPAEVAQLTTAGINFITNPIPYGAVWGLRHNQNASSSATVNGVNYTRMTNFLSRSFAKELGKFIGRLQSSRANDETRADAYATLSGFLNRLKQPALRGGFGMIDDFALQLDADNNPPERVAEGIMRADVRVRYLAVVRFFIVSLTAGQNVVTVTSSTQPGIV